MIADRIKQLIRRGLREVDTQLTHLHRFHTGVDFVLTGIPRSGTSLMCSVLSESDNGFCFNEVHSYYSLNFELLRARLKIALGMPVRNKLDTTGGVTSDTNRSSHRVGDKRLDKSARGLVLGTNQNIPYLNRLDHVFRLSLPVLALVRHPLFTLLSWNSDEVTSIPEARLTETHLHNRYRDIDFISNNRYEMQAQIWEYYADLIWRNREDMTVVTYEDFTENTDTVLKKLTDRLNITFSSQPTLENRNILERYDSASIHEIERAVEKLCPSRHRLGYE